MLTRLTHVNASARFRATCVSRKYRQRQRRNTKKKLLQCCGVKYTMKRRYHHARSLEPVYIPHHTSVHVAHQSATQVHADEDVSREGFPSRNDIEKTQGMPVAAKRMPCVSWEKGTKLVSHVFTYRTRKKSQHQGDKKEKKKTCLAVAVAPDPAVEVNLHIRRLCQRQQQKSKRQIHAK